MEYRFNVLAELERCGIKFEHRTDGEVTILCPFHEDSTPSCHVNPNKQVFKCYTAGCGAKGDAIQLLARYLKVTRFTVIADLAARYAWAEDKLVAIETVEKYHAAIWQAGALREELYKRALNDDDIRLYRLGVDKSRITIPIKNAHGAYVNIRKYLPGAPNGQKKFMNLKGQGLMRLFPIDQLRFPEIMICGGECKAIVAARELNPHNIGAICASGGEGNWEPGFDKEFAGKTLYICLDVDNPGLKAAEMLAFRLNRVAEWLGIVSLPLDLDRYPKGDINDYKALGEQLLPLVRACLKYEPPPAADYLDISEPKSLALADAITAVHARARVLVPAVVTAVDTSPYIIPAAFTVRCDRSLKECALCKVFIDDKNDYDLPAESPAILEMVAAPKGAQIEALKAAIGIPRTCRICECDVHKFYNIEDARISPQLEITNRASDNLLQPALCIGAGLELNEVYNLTGRMHPHPKTQQSTLLISGYETRQDALSSYKCDNIEDLGIFWPRDWTAKAIHERLTDIYSDFSANVTRIYQRQDLHLAVDLCYHSPLFFEFDGKLIKGWIETLICGDSAQGKSEVTCGSAGPGGLMAHYGLGAKVVCKTASVAGLLGGLQKMGDRYFVSWGLIPSNDKRLVVLEEVKGAPVEIIAKLTDMRSSGVAEIPKIEKRKTHARTRLIWLSNPRGDVRLCSYNFGVEAIKDLIGNLEDIRRFDYALLVSGSEINQLDLNMLQAKREHIPHIFTSELCRKLVLWAWTRGRGQVIFDAEATDLILKKAVYFCDKYTDAIPLVDRGSMRYKLARIAASLAARTFSCSEDFETCYVWPAHVEYVADWLDRIYSSQVFGYLDFSNAMNISENLLDAERIKEKIQATPFPSDLCKSMLAKSVIDLQDFCDWCAWERYDAMDLLSFFVRKHALIRDGRSYRKSPKFIELIKELLHKGQLVDRPEHVPEY